MNDPRDLRPDRRSLLKVVAAGTIVAAAAAPFAAAEGDRASHSEKRRARYQPNSADVQNFYRVNRYPAK